MFQNISLIKRIGFLGLFTIISIISIITLSIGNLSIMNNNFNKVVDVDARRVVLSKDIQKFLIEMPRAEKNMILALTQADMDMLREEFNHLKQQLDSRVLELRELIDDESKDKVDTFKINYEKYVKVFNDIATLTRANTNQKAKELLREDARDNILLLNTLIDELRNEISKDINNKMNQMNINNKLPRKLKALELISSVESNILKSVRDTGQAILALTDKEIEELGQRSSKFLKLVLASALELKKITDSTKNNKIDRILIILEDYNRMQIKILALTQKNSNRKANDLSAGTARTFINKAIRNMSDIAKINATNMKTARAVSDTRYINSRNALWLVFSVLTFLIIYLGVQIYRFLNQRLGNIYSKIEIIKSGNFYNDEDDKTTTDELGLVSSAMNNAITLLRENSIMNEKQRWIKEGVNDLNLALSGEIDIVQVSNKSINFLCTYLNAGVGAIYSFNENNKVLNRVGSYAYVQREELSSIFKLGEGTIGQVGLQRTPILLRNIKRTKLVIDTGTTSEPPLNTYTFPLMYQNELLGVIELGSSEMFDEKASEFFELSNSIIATAMYTAKQNNIVRDLLTESEAVNTQMAEQQEELEEANAQMEDQQQQLEEANAQMEEQQQQLKEKNEILKQSSSELAAKAKDLEISNQYKSEFLSNMSHELRTPLNSIILLSQMIKDDKFNHLDEEEITKASIINSSGNELLRLVNDILDLSKIEAGKMEIMVDEFNSTHFSDNIYTQFEHPAKEKNLELITTDSYKGTILSDENRLSQIVRNLISNSLKFTKKGSISLNIEHAPDDKIKISVCDTGIGISKEKLESIFEAFKQADGGTSREYGGTGLGLSISKELVTALGGEISVSSELDEGSTFTIVIPNMTKPENQEKNSEPKIKKESISEKKTQHINDDRDIITALDKPFLIIEDDEEFANTLKEKINEQKEYALIALNGEDGLALAQQYDVKAVMLDLELPDIDGIDVIKEFKMNLGLRKIPIYVISESDKEDLTAKYGAIGFTQKPIQNNEIIKIIKNINIFNNKIVKDLLIVEDNKNERESLIELIGNGTVRSTGVATQKEAIKELDRGIYDGVIVDLGLEEGSGYEVCEYIHKNHIHVPIIIYTGKDLTAQEEQVLRKYTDHIMIKTVSSEKSLLDQVDIFMHRVKVGDKGTSINVNDIDLSGKNILIADDDIRNIYVLSEALGSKGAKILTAKNGKKAIETLDENPDVDIILMDIMMPVMDGYETTKIIKENPKTKDIPIIAVTAKAMEEDRQNCLDAGCDDYISKPLKMEILLGLIKGWLSRS